MHPESNGAGLPPKSPDPEQNSSSIGRRLDKTNTDLPGPSQAMPRRARRPPPWRPGEATREDLHKAGTIHPQTGKPVTALVYDDDSPIEALLAKGKRLQWEDRESAVQAKRQEAKDNGASVTPPPPRNNAPAPRQPRAKKRVVVTMGADITPQSITWLWRDWLAHGKLHLLAGRPGSLKTTAAIGFAATITIGGQWPDGSKAAQAKVIIWSGEDAINDTLLPRFLAAGGDPNEIAFISGVEDNGKSHAFDPSRDIADIADICADLGSVNLIIIDPIVVVTKGDSHKNAEARRDLQPLVDLAEQTQAAIIGIHHLTKRTEGTDPVDRVSGSLAFGAAPRGVMFSAIDHQAPPGETKGILFRGKYNSAPSHGGFEFTADTRPLADYPAISAQRILWGNYVNESASDIFERLEGKAEKKGQSERKAGTFLRLKLQDGPGMAGELIKEAAALGISESALHRARKKLGVVSTKLTYGTGWIWELPKQDGDQPPKLDA
jgi:putative DNA primase/helicase